MKKKLQLFLSWLAFAALSGCFGPSGDPGPPQVYTSVAITHVAPDCPGLNILVDDKSLGATALLYKDYTGYIFMDPGVRNLKFKSAADGNLLINSSPTFEQYKAYSVFVTTVATNTFETWVVEDFATLSSLDKFMIRFAHISPDAPKAFLKIVENGFVFATKSYKEISVFNEMDPKPYTLEVRAESDGSLILSKTFTPVPGSFYTASLVGFKTPPSNNTNQLDLIIIKSQ